MFAGGWAEMYNHGLEKAALASDGYVAASRMPHPTDANQRVCRELSLIRDCSTPKNIATVTFKTGIQLNSHKIIFDLFTDQFSVGKPLGDGMCLAKLNSLCCKKSCRPRPFHHTSAVYTAELCGSFAC